MSPQKPGSRREAYRRRQQQTPNGATQQANSGVGVLAATSTPAQDARAAALAAHEAGLCVVPPREDGSKAPITEMITVDGEERQSWTQWQKSRPERSKVDAWYTDGRTGVGVITGAVSGGLEAIDFDDRPTYEAFKKRAVDFGIDDLVERIESGYLGNTPNGVRWLIRCEVTEGNIKLARRPKKEDEKEDANDKVKATIETRGDGGFAIVPPSSGSVHPSGRAYLRGKGSFKTIVTLTREERESIFDLARSFDEMPARKVHIGGQSEVASGRPGDVFNEKASWAEILEPHGWTFAYSQGDEDFWTRPGKNHGPSASTNFAGTGLFHVFTTSTQFEGEENYSRFAVYAELNHGGDYAAAARQLRAEGYGDRSLGARASLKDSYAEPTQEWLELQDLPSATPVPTLPSDLLPEPFQDWIVDAAQRAPVPIEYIAICAITGLGAVIGRQVGIRPEKFDDYLVVPNLWGAIVGGPGKMKTYAVSEGLRHVRRLETTAADSYDGASTSRESEEIRIRAEIDNLQTAIKQALSTKDSEEADALQIQLTELFAQRDTAAAPARRYLTQDSTVEKLGVMLKENPRGLLIFRDELAGWLRALEKAGREGDREFYLEAWNGTGGYNVDRIGRGNTRIPALTLSLCGGIQPGKLKRYITEAIGDGDGADGLLQRVQLLVWPDAEAFPEWRESRQWPDKDAKQRAWAVFERLSTIELPTGLDADPDHDSSEIPALHFTVEAQQLHTQWRGELENRLRHETTNTPAFEAHLSKYRSLAPALALVYYLAELPAGEAIGDVSLGALKKALGLCDFLEAHARKVFAAELNPGLEAAYALSQKIRAGAVKHGDTVREVYRHGWSGIGSSREAFAAVEVLQQYGWVRLQREGTDGRTKDILSLHPQLRGNSDG